ncbi:hypothetical protein L1049_011244 [Liquidambar formosana]|uniref:Germin-like protein n=1 Tax=Liquidambar formosana TaxID=63359 RepID=A0AAP0RQZ3_LIQFO
MCCLSVEAKDFLSECFLCSSPVPSSSVNRPHTHPHLAELLFLLGGSLEVGFVDMTNKIFMQTLQAGDLFVFPKGLVHYQCNGDSKNFAIAVSAFVSANAGTVSVPSSIFTNGIDDGILAKSFKTDVCEIHSGNQGWPGTQALR